MSSSNPSSASFETSFDNDVAFKSLIESSNNNDKSTNISNTDYQSALQSDDDQDQQQKQDSHPEDLNLFISDLLEQMQSKFDNMGNTILGRIDDMGSRIDSLEKSIGGMMDQAGLSEPTSTYRPSAKIAKNVTDKSDH